jgi:ADP-ribose 1''-phosphate phosphatase
MITYEKISLFDVLKGSIIIHAVNAQGVWGSGIAKEFKERYPKSYEHYNYFCKNYTALGRGTFSNFKEEKHQVGWICTSKNYGDKKDNPIQILTNTTLALIDLCDELDATRSINGYSNITVYSNKFNSGLFNVPWSNTEIVLNEILKRYPNINWIIADPNLNNINSIGTGWE